MARLPDQSEATPPKGNASAVKEGPPRGPIPIKPLDKPSSIVHMHIQMSQERNMTAIENCVCLNLRRVTRAVTQFFDAEMRRHGIRPTQWTILQALNAKKTWSMAELSSVLGMDRTTLVRNVRPLQRDGWVQAAGGGRGSRVELSITAKGREKIKESLPAWHAAQRAAVETLGEQRWSTLLSDLETAALSLAK
jgi:DNA-binding MarR family transcriptional regulator